jgi:hypothetical protein
MAIYSRKKDASGKVTKTMRNPLTGKTRTIVKYKEADGRKRKTVSVRTRKQQAKQDERIKKGDPGHHQYETTKSKDKSQWEVGGPKYKQFNKSRGEKGHKYREKGIIVKSKYGKGEKGEKGYKKGFGKTRRAIFGPGLDSVQTMLKRDHARKYDWKRQKGMSKADFAREYDLDMSTDVGKGIVKDFYQKNPKRIFFQRKSTSRYNRKRRND